MYNPKIWYDGDIVTSGGLNNIEQGIAQNAHDIEDLQGALGGDMESYVDSWLDSHPEVTTTVQDGALTEPKFADSLKLKTIKDYVTPQMFGAKGDGTTDDTNAIISAFNSGKTVFFPSGTYAVSRSIEINHDVRVICDAQCLIIPIANMDALFKIGVSVDGFTNPVFSGLVKVLWDGGTLFGAHSDYAVTDVIYTEKTYHCKFTNVTIANVSTNGIHIAGSIGAYCIFEKCVVRGKNGNGTRGFLIERSDQQILNCSVIDCLHGYETNANCILFDGCTAWMSSDTNWNNTICFHLGGAFNKLVNCIVDTMYYGIRFKSNFKYGSASNLFWTNNYAVVTDTTNMSLLSTDDPSTGYLVNFPVIGLIVDNLQNTAYLKRDISSAYHTFIDDIVAYNPSNIADLSTASCYVENKTYDNGNGTNRLQKTNNGLRFVHDSELSAVTPNTVITLTTWAFTSISGTVPVTCINNNNGELITTCALYCNNGILQFLLKGSTTYNLKLHVDIEVPQYSI